MERAQPALPQRKLEERPDQKDAVAERWETPVLARTALASELPALPAPESLEREPLLEAVAPSPCAPRS
jgi:hypothetical protein